MTNHEIVSSDLRLKCIVICEFSPSEALDMKMFAILISQFPSSWRKEEVIRLLEKEWWVTHSPYWHTRHLRFTVVFSNFAY